MTFATNDAIVKERDSSSLSIVILAGGHSSRMGRDKALLALPSGLTLLAHTIQTAQPLASDIWVVTPWPERYQLTVPSSVQFALEPTLDSNSSTNSPTDKSAEPRYSSGREKPSAGPLSGFLHGWQQVSADWCLLLPCDMPYLETPVLQRWWHWIVGQQVQGWPDYQQLPMASLATGAKGWEPLCGFYHRRSIERISHQLRNGPRSFQALLMNAVIAPYAAPSQMFFNCNRPTDWSAVKWPG